MTTVTVDTLCPVGWIERYVCDQCGHMEWDRAALYCKMCGDRLVLWYEPSYFDTDYRVCGHCGQIEKDNNIHHCKMCGGLY